MHIIQKYRHKKGFTLAEVLITLTIIGVIAALTIPSLITNIQNQDLIVAKKRAFSILTQAYVSAVRENSGGFGDYGCGHFTKIPAIMSQLNIVKTCSGNTFGNCWAPNGVTPYGTGGCSSGFSQAGQNGDSGYITSDGMYLLHYTTCDIIAVDVNGPRGPNQWDKDVFAIAINDASINIGGCCSSDKTFLTQ